MTRNGDGLKTEVKWQRPPAQREHARETSMKWVRVGARFGACRTSWEESGRPLQCALQVRARLMV